MTADWPVPLEGVTETVVTTRGPNGRWNAAALGVRADPRAADRTDGESPEGSRATTEPATARTWGNTRTRRNFEREGRGYVQFTRDPVLFVEAALSIRESADPLLDAADAWVEVDARRVDAGEDGGTRWEAWELAPLDAGVERRTVPTINRGFGAVVEATVAASRLGVSSYDAERLRERLDYFASVVERCGGAREREAMDRLGALCDWTPSDRSA